MVLEAEPDDAVGGHCTDCNLKFDTRADLTEHYKVRDRQLSTLPLTACRVCNVTPCFTCTLLIVTIVVNFTLV